MKALRSALQSYGVAVLSVGLATVVRLAFDPVWQSNFPFLTFFPAVLITAWYGGLWPGIVSILLSAVTATVLWVAPEDWNHLDRPVALVGPVVYVGTCVMMVLLTNVMRRARQDAEQAMRAKECQAAEYSRIAIHNARLYEASKLAEEQARRYAVRLQLLDENARLLSSAGLNLEKITEAATRRMAELIGDFCSIRFLEPEGAQFSRGVVRHLDPSLAETTLLDALREADAGEPESEEAAISFRVVESGESVWIPDLAADSSLAIGPLRIYSLLIAPLKARGRATGVLSLMRTRPGRAYTEEDRWLLEELADRISLAVENARLHAETSKSEERALRQVARVAALARVSKALVQAGPDAQAIFDTITKESAELLGDHCALRMLSADGRQLPVKSFWHRRLSARMKLRELYAGEPTGLYPVYRSILESGEPLFLRENALTALQGGFYPYHLDFVERYGLTAFYVVPLRIGGRPIGTLAIGRDGNGRPYTEEDQLLFEEMADRASVAIEKAQLFEQVQQANRRKDEFLAMLGHELRNPIAAMLGAHRAADALRDEKTQAQAHDILARQIRHMSRLVDDLLDVSRITRGKIELKREPIELARLICETCADMREMAETKGLLLEIEGLENLLRPEPAARADADFWPRIWSGWNTTASSELWVSSSNGLWVDGDRTRLMQVLTSLLTNAIKFTDAGGRIVIRVEKENREDADWVSVSVRDTGIGIEPSVLPFVFDSLTQADRSLDRTRGGLGLGLALAWGLMELHNGEISAHSDGIGKGAAFTIRLPLLSPDVQGSEPSGMAQRPAAVRTGDLSSPIRVEMKTEAPARSLRVLVIDDNVDSADMICLMLKLYGHQVEAVYSSSVGLDLASQSNYDAICCDIGLPEMDGYEFARELRRRGYSGLLIAVSGYGREEDRRHSRQAGFDVHLVKPVEPDELGKTLQETERVPSPESGIWGPESTLP